MKRTFLVALIIGSLSVAASAEIITFFTPVAGGYISYNTIWSKGFDAQTGTTLDTTDITWIDNYSGIGYYDNRMAWLDFGENWASVNVVSTWTGYTRSSGTRLVEDWLQDLWWDDDIDNTNDGVTDTALMNGLNAIVGPATGSPEWIEQANTGFTPQARYMILHTTSSHVNPWSQRVNEFIFEVPEPATMSLLGFGGIAALIRRRRG